MAPLFCWPGSWACGGGNGLSVARPATTSRGRPAFPSWLPPPSPDPKVPPAHPPAQAEPLAWGEVTLEHLGTRGGWTLPAAAAQSFSKWLCQAGWAAAFSAREGAGSAQGRKQQKEVE